MTTITTTIMNDFIADLSAEDRDAVKRRVDELKDQFAQANSASITVANAAIETACVEAIIWMMGRNDEAKILRRQRDDLLRALFRDRWWHADEDRIDTDGSTLCREIAEELSIPIEFVRAAVQPDADAARITDTRFWKEVHRS